MPEENSTVSPPSSSPIACSTAGPGRVAVAPVAVRRGVLGALQVERRGEHRARRERRALLRRAGGRRGRRGSRGRGRLVAHGPRRLASADGAPPRPHRAAAGARGRARRRGAAPGLAARVRRRALLRRGPQRRGELRASGPSGAHWSFRGTTTYRSASVVKAMLLVAYLRRGGVRGPRAAAGRAGAARPDDPALGQRRRDRGPRARRHGRARRAGAPGGDARVRAPSRLGRLADHRGRPGAVLPADRPAAAAAPPALRDAPAADGDPGPALGDRRGGPGRLEDRLQGRLGAGRDAGRRPPGRAVHERRAAGLARGADGGQPVGRLRPCDTARHRGAAAARARRSGGGRARARGPRAPAADSLRPCCACSCSASSSSRSTDGPCRCPTDARRGRCSATSRCIPGRTRARRWRRGLWPDVLDESARTSLRGALADVRRALGAAADGASRRDPRRESACATWRRTRRTRRTRHRRGGARAVARAAAGRPRGRRLARRRARDDRATRGALLAALADAAAAAGDHAGAVARARERVALEPLSEEAHRELIARLAAAGDRAAALTAYERLAERLRRELRIAPSAPTRELVARDPRRRRRAARAAPGRRPAAPRGLRRPARALAVRRARRGARPAARRARRRARRRAAGGGGQRRARDRQVAPRRRGARGPHTTRAPPCWRAAATRSRSGRSRRSSRRCGRSASCAPSPPPTRARRGCGCSTRSPGCSPARPGSAPCCSSSTTCTGPTGRRCGCSPTWPPRRSRPRCCSSARTARPTSGAVTRSPRCSPTCGASRAPSGSRSTGSTRARPRA